jgi:hypothetical protein
MDRSALSVPSENLKIYETYLYIIHVCVPEKGEGGQFCVICLLLTEVMDISFSGCYWPSKSVKLFCSVSYNKLIYMILICISSDMNRLRS